MRRLQADVRREGVGQMESRKEEVSIFRTHCMGLIPWWDCHYSGHKRETSMPDPGRSHELRKWFLPASGMDAFHLWPEKTVTVTHQGINSIWWALTRADCFPLPSISPLPSTDICLESPPCPCSVYTSLHPDWPIPSDFPSCYPI
jgi:hypothetical protein